MHAPTLWRHLAAALMATVAMPGLTEALSEIKGGADPSTMKSGDSYYSVGTCGNGNICVRKASSLVGIGKDSAESKTVWKDNGKGDVWAPEITTYDGKTYIYFAAGAKGAHRMYAISADSPLGTYSSETKINLPGDKFAIDGILFTFEKQLWMVWSGWGDSDNSEQSLYICKMKSPTEPSGDRHVISQPREGWETKAGLINEAPEAIIDPNGQLHIAYSANGSWGSKYCLADLRLKKGGNPENVWDWYKSNGCLFGSYQENMMKGWDATKEVDGPGHHSFDLTDGDVQKSPKGSDRVPFVYHAVPKGTEYKWGNRNWYAGSFVWWSKTKYHRGGNSPGDKDNVGYSFKFFE